MAYIRPPTVKVETALGPVTMSFTRGDHVFVHVDGHHNDVAPVLVYRGQEYIGSVHLHLDLGPDGTWSTWRPGARRPDSGSWSKRGKNQEAPRTHAEALTAACAEALTEVLRAQPDLPRRAAYASASNDLGRLADQEASLMLELGKVRVEMGKVRAAMDAAER